MAPKKLKRAGYRLPPGPRGDAPGGVGTSSSPRGNRTGDMRMGYNTRRNEEAYRRGLGRDGGMSQYGAPGRPQIPKDRLRPVFPKQGVAPPGQLPHLQGRRKRGNRYYRTD